MNDGMWRARRGAAARAAAGALIAAGSMASVAAPAAAAPWEPPTEIAALPGSQGNARPMVAINRAGDAVAVWTREHPAPAPPPPTSGRRRGPRPSYYDVQAASRPAGGRWQPPVTISARSTAPGTDISPVVAIDDRGTAVALWSRRDGRRFRVEAATRPAGGGWSSPRRISQADVDSHEPALAMTASGSAIAIWIAHHRTSRRVVRIATKAPGRRWRPSRPLSDDRGAATLPALAIGRGGAAAVVWNQQTVPSDVYSPWKLKARLRTARGAWRPTATLAQSASGVLPKVAVDARGEALAAWMTQPPSRQAGARFRPSGLRSVETRGGRWSTPRRINPRSHDLRDLDENVEIAVDDAGRATAVWTILQGGVWAARKPPRGAWGKAIRLSAAEGYSDAFPTAAGDGRTIVTWVEHVRGVRTAEAGPGAGWQPAITLDPAAVAASEGASPGYEPSVATAGRQRAIVWTAFEDAADGGRTVLKAAFGAP